MSKFLWTQRSDFGPAPRAEHAMAFDSQRERTVLFGGNSGNAVLGDTWEWDGSFWTQVDDTGPGPRSGHAMVYDSARQVSILFGGRQGSTEHNESVSSLRSSNRTWGPPSGSRTRHQVFALGRL